MKQADQRCDNCRFWDDLDGTSGDCRRRPPVIVDSVVTDPDNHDDGVSRRDMVWDATWFPVTVHDEWCGEWAPAEDS